MNRWKITGLMATVVIILSVPIYLAKTAYIGSQTGGIQPAPTDAFVGTLKCMECHQKQYDDWQDSHHDHAMANADHESVLGDFNDTEITFHGVNSRFYQRDGRYFTYTQGIDGQMGEYEITHTFGWYPLQQYLVPFPGGRLQCLPIAWDVQKKKWYHLYPDEPQDPKDWLYWTNAAQNWNGMCAECHSTNLQKRYDPDSDSYATTWDEIDVSCETCHGPGRAHVEWAEEAKRLGIPAFGHHRLLVDFKNGDSRYEIDVCAPCHGEPLRHARFQQWQLSAHANYEVAIDEGSSGNCSRCHTGNGFLTWLPVLLGDEPGDPLDSIDVTWTEDEVHPQTCQTCHDPHNIGTTSGADPNATVRISGDTPPLIAGFSFSYAA